MLLAFNTMIENFAEPQTCSAIVGPSAMYNYYLYVPQDFQLIQMIDTY